MNPYMLLIRDPRTFDRMTGEMSHTPRADRHFHDRDGHRPAVSVSLMISTGTLHTFNAVERGWGRVTRSLRG